MARDTRGNSAFASGMRGREKPKVQDAHGKTAVNDSPGSDDPLSTHRQEPGKSIGMPGGVSQTDSVYSSGMRGMEKAKQKPASGAANKEVQGGAAPGNKQAAGTHIGEPAGHDDAGEGARKGVQDSHLQRTAAAAHELGIAGNNTEESAAGENMSDDAGILGEEDDTHINLRIPKASLKKKAAGLQTS